MTHIRLPSSVFFFNYTATTEIYTLSLHDALPISGTVTDAGTLATALELESDTASPPVGAAPESVTVPVELAPEVTVAGLSPTAVALGPTVTGSRVSVADNVTPPPETEIVTSVL